MGMTAALKLRSIVDNLEMVLAGEILAACQAMEFRKPLQPGAGTKRAFSLVREHDRMISPDLSIISGLIRRNCFADLLRRKSG